MIEFFDDIFDDLDDNSKRSIPFMIYPNVFSDSRGTFSEVMKCGSKELENIQFLNDMSWIKQMNRSSSSSGVIRGCHAQKAPFCQAKLVEALTEPIIDFIIDARPESKSFGVISFFTLSPIKQNKLFVPRGFLHGFIVEKELNVTNAIFNYYCDNIYDKASDLSINPKTILPKIKSLSDTIEHINFDEYEYSEKDLNGLDYETWMTEIKNEYKSAGKSWWRIHV